MSPTQILRIADGRLAGHSFLDDPALTRLLDVLDRDGETARVVGGAVRNALLGLTPGDIDVATTALPQVVIARAKAARLRTIPTGVAHGTVTVMVGSSAFEVTTLREDVETDGRHAVVRFGRDFERDALRRDFTINALSVSADGTIHDMTGGLTDLAAGRVRFIGEADQRIREDYLRILRFFRFSAAYGRGALDPDGLGASIANRDAIGRLSRERIRAELLKLLVAPHAPTVVSRMDASGIAGIVLGGPAFPVRLARLAAIEAARENPPDAILRLAALAVAEPADPDRLRASLRLSNAERNRLAVALAARLEIDGTSAPAPASLRALLFGFGAEAARDGLDLASVNAAPATESAWAEAARFLRQEPPPELPLSGQDVLARGVTSGRMVGRILKRLQADWIRAGFPKDPSTLAALLEAAITAEQSEHS